MRVRLRGAWCMLACALSACAARDMRDVALWGNTNTPYASLPIGLADLELSNIVLATSVDGSLHGLDRASGASLWSLRARVSDSTFPILRPLVASFFGKEQRSLQQIAAEAIASGDPAMIKTLQTNGIYIVEPSSGGDMYVLRAAQDQGIQVPKLEKMPFSLPDLVELSPFSLRSDDTRIFVAEKQTQLVEINLFTGKIAAMYDSRDAQVAHEETPKYSYMHKSDADAIESPWVYIGRTDYTLTVHVRNDPEAVQTLRYSVYAPNNADRDVAALWESNPQHDSRAMLASPETNAIMCFDMRLAKNPKRGAQPLPPLLWKHVLNSTAVDIFDVVFAPMAHASLLRPMVVPHSARMLPEIIAQQEGVGAPSTYLGSAGSGALYALGRARFPLVETTDHAAITQPGHEPLITSDSLAAFVGGYDVSNVPNHIGVPLLDTVGRGMPRIGPAETLPSLPASPGFFASGRALVPSGYITLRLLGAALLLFVLLRGYQVIHAGRAPVVLSTDALLFEETAWDDKRHTPKPRIPTKVPESSEEESVHAPGEDAAKRRRRRRGRRAGATVSARGNRAETPSVPDRGSDSFFSHAPSVENTELPANTLLNANDNPTSLQLSSEVLGYGSSGTVVFRGEFQGRAVAVKRLLRDFVQIASKEVSLLQSADNHPNVIRHYCQELTPNFLFIALEQCPASIADLVERPAEFSALSPFLEPRDAFLQITAGLQHLHSLSIVHRDIKPQNILVQQKPGNKLRVLLSDFGLSKRIDGAAQNSFSQSMTQPGGTVGWRAPEVLFGRHPLLTNDGSMGDEAGRLTRAVDIFSLGCVAFYLLTQGGHPFGTQYEREINILKQCYDLAPLGDTCDEVAEIQALIKSMIDREPANRPLAAHVAIHPFFWSAQKRLAFLQDVSDRLETLEREPPAPALALLELNADKVIGSDWRRAFDKAFLDDVGRFRKYDQASIQDLLRVIRNKKHHFQDMPQALQKQLGEIPDGFLFYFTRRFPFLFHHVYETMQQLPVLRGEPAFRDYFVSDAS
ncbi:non-specific serine/threonine protein kinase [Malassezia vespertilionis]|uniref:non-specific serine/threonine protein kinase n=1 Tax=Malassezia vespertilionis TaxID=2020962 RepID=A0A2N1JGQ1_9BASI|nr:non-specific serine/threonine protein kinase [Malassezia vespertilionis]PKI85731.1 Ire1p [Malassezia vespertilionis]WFD05373.1 non-specific serine/threonine protein kinase [Malassezia vespertilionis]